MRINQIALALGLTSAITLVGCDGGSSSSSPTPVSNTYSVKAIDGYLRNAKVWLDINPNYIHDEGEPSAYTGEGGLAELDVSDIDDYLEHQLVVHAIAGETIDEDTIDSDNPTGQPMQGSLVMSAPAGESNVTPLSTLVNIVMNKNASVVQAPEQREQLKQQVVKEVASQLGLDPDNMLDDYLSDEKENPQAAFAAQSIVQSEQVLPESPEEMAILAQDVQGAGDSASEDVPQLKLAAAVNEQIKQVVETTDEEELINTPPPVEPPADDTPPADDDADGVPNHLDEFPDNANEWVDSDDDNVGNNSDDFPFDPTEQLDTDEDGEGNNADLDDDGDTFNDDIDQYRLDATKAGDHDNDGIDSVNDTYPFDHDNDGYPDDQDAFDDDNTEWLDTDGDGDGNNRDHDDDNDGYDDGDDAFPLNSSKAGDHDNDGIDSISDSFPFDHDNDGYDDDVDLFDDDPSEWADFDSDTIGDNADPDDDDDGINDEDDEYPYDDTQAGDPDEDGVDSLNDAYPNDATKSVADQLSRANQWMPVLNINHREVTWLLVDVEQQVETFNDGSQTTTTTTLYTNEGGIEYGYKESIDIQTGSDFSRIEEFAFDFNLDGDASFVGRTLDIGSRSSDSETFWRYVDESDASLEGGVNGTGRSYQNSDFSDRAHPSNLTNIDTIQWFSVSYSHEGDIEIVSGQMTQFDVTGFDYSDDSTHVADYASSYTSRRSDLLETAMVDEQDWDADGSVNTILAFEINDDESYISYIAEPVWANPQDGISQEYADFNFTPGNWDNLTSYWSEQIETHYINGDIVASGERYVLDASSNTKLEEEGEPLLFHEWSSNRSSPSINERNEYVSWIHYPLDEYDFTTSTLDPGQAYRIESRLDSGVWFTVSFDEWGSQDVEDLAGQVEDARSSGTSMFDIDSSIIPGLSRYAAVLANASFQYTDQGEARQWYAVTQDPRTTDGTPSLVEMTLTDHGVMPDSYVVSNGPDLLLLAPLDADNTWPWYDAYYRQFLNVYQIDLDSAAFNWTTDLGQLFLDEQAALERLDEVLNPEYRLCSSEDTGERFEPADTYSDFVAAAYNCGYIGLDVSYLDEPILYHQQDSENYFSYQFYADGSGVYEESNDYSDDFSWWMNDDGIITIDKAGDMAYFAYIADENDRYSLLGFFEWDQDGVPYSEIIGLEMTSYLSTGYRVCTEGDTEWDDIADKPASSPQYADLEQAVADCDGAMPFTNEMVDGLVWHDYNVDKDRLKIWTFFSDGSVVKSKNGVISGTYSWSIDSNGYLVITYDISNPDDFTIFALIASEDDRFSVKTLESYPQEVAGETEIWSEIVTDELTTSNPLDKASVIATLISESNWFEPWTDWHEGDEQDYLYVNHIDMTEPELIAFTGTSIVESNKALTALDSSDEYDLMLTSDGWERVFGFEVDLADESLVFTSPDAPELTYSTIYASVYDKEGGNIAEEAPGDWAHYYSDTEFYPSGSKVVALTIRNDYDAYYLFDEHPYQFLGEAGVDGDGSHITSFDSLFVTSSVGSSAQADLLHGTSIIHDVGIELVRPSVDDIEGVANYYYTDWDLIEANLIASGSWEIRELNGERLVLFEVPQIVIDDYEYVLDSQWVFYSIYRSESGGDDLVHTGEFYPARGEPQEPIYLYNTIATEAILNAADLP
ncbi:hypothetical protein [Vibrio sp. WXL103]|uniref:hypothetical protein n=1 Tax=Vibrio sp. WXL103 TaxID=3450710 RepID=UPI003EC4AF07